MTTLILCMLFVVVLPYLVKLPLMYAMSQATGGYDNNYPRLQQASLQGFGARVAAAHQNCFESLAVFSTAALTALATNHVSQTIQYLAITYVITRIIYIFFYFMNLATLRSTIWFIGLLCCISIMWLCLP